MRGPESEDIYDLLLRDDTVVPDATGTLTFTLEGRARELAWQSRPNTVWRRGFQYRSSP
jgi:hypothetical protein